MELNAINLSEKRIPENDSYSELEIQLLDVLKQGPMTRDQLVTKLEIPRTTIYDGLKKLMNRKEVSS